MTSVSGSISVSVGSTKDVKFTNPFFVSSISSRTTRSNASTKRSSTASSACSLRRPVRRPSIEFEPANSDCGDDSSPSGSNSKEDQPSDYSQTKELFQDHAPLHSKEDGVHDSPQSEISCISSDYRIVLEEEPVDTIEYCPKDDDDDDDDSDSSDNSVETAVTGNISSSRQQHDPIVVSADVLPFKGNPSRRENRKQNQHSGTDKLKENKRKMEDHDFDLHSKPGVIRFENEQLLLGDDDNVNDDDVQSHCTSPSRRTHASCSSSSSFTLTEERIRSHMKDYYEDYDTIFRYGKSSRECWEAFFRQYFTDDVLWVRSTGNPIGREGLAKLLAEDIVGISMSIVSMDNIQILAGGMAAVVVFTADQKYVYLGKAESDRTVITSVLHVVNGSEILIGHEHRCVGKPIPKDTRWES